MPPEETSGPEATPGEPRSIEYEDYTKERGLLASFEKKSLESFQRAILTLSSSFLAFSLTFIGIMNRLLPERIQFESLYKLEISWIAFAVSMVLMILSYVLEIFDYRREVHHAEVLHEKGESAAKQIGNPYGISATIVQALSGVAFLAGVVFLLMFCTANLEKMGGQYGEETRPLCTASRESCTTQDKTEDETTQEGDDDDSQRKEEVR